MVAKRRTPIYSGRRLSEISQDMVDAAPAAYAGSGDVTIGASSHAAPSTSSLLNSLSPRVRQLLLAQPLNPLVRGEFEVLPSGVKTLQRGIAVCAFVGLLGLMLCGCKHFPVPGVDQHENNHKVFGGDQ